MRINNFKQEAFRNERLIKCARLTSLMLGVTEQQLGALIQTLYDRKGTLMVQWFHKPSGKGQLAVDEAWRECKESKTLHFWPETDAPAELYEIGGEHA
jgi:hypothetical protein